MDSTPLAAAAAHTDRPSGPDDSRTARTNGRGNGNGGAPAPDGPLLPPDSPLLKDLSVTLEARLGEAVMPVTELLALRAGSVIDLATQLNEPVELYLNHALVGRGEIVAVDDRFGVRIVEIAAA